MPDSVDLISPAKVNHGSFAPGSLGVLVDGDHSLRYRGAPRSASAVDPALLEPVNGWLWKQCTGDGVLTTFTFPQAMPINVHIINVAVYVSGTAGTAATTVAIGKSGTTGAYMAATSFTSSMNAAGAKAVTVVRVHETTSITPIVTFSAAWDSGAKCLVGIHYIKAPAIV